MLSVDPNFDAKKRQAKEMITKTILLFCKNILKSCVPNEQITLDCLLCLSTTTQEVMHIAIHDQFYTIDDDNQTSVDYQKKIATGKRKRSFGQKTNNALDVLPLKKVKTLVNPANASIDDNNQATTTNLRSCHVKEPPSKLHCEGNMSKSTNIIIKPDPDSPSVLSSQPVFPGPIPTVYPQALMIPPVNSQPQNPHLQNSPVYKNKTLPQCKNSLEIWGRTTKDYLINSLLRTNGSFATTRMISRKCGRRAEVVRKAMLELSSPIDSENHIGITVDNVGSSGCMVLYKCPPTLIRPHILDKYNISMQAYIAMYNSTPKDITSTYQQNFIESKTPYVDLLDNRMDVVDMPSNETNGGEDLTTATGATKSTQQTLINQLEIRYCDDDLLANDDQSECSGDSQSNHSTLLHCSSLYDRHEENFLKDHSQLSVENENQEKYHPDMSKCAREGTDLQGSPKVSGTTQYSSENDRSSTESISLQSNPIENDCLSELQSFINGMNM